MEKVAITSDHAGFHLKNKLINYLTQRGIHLDDLGAYIKESDDYPIYAHNLAKFVTNGTYDFGISLCGTGNGINMTINKHQGIRSALCWKEEIAVLARKHNNANVCSLPAWYVSEEQAYAIVDAFLKVQFEGGRHERRINKIPLTNNNYDI